MDQAEFDKFAAEYTAIHTENVRISGESPEYFAEYKTIDVAGYLAAREFPVRRLLDFGAGVGSSVPHFRKQLPGARITCLDVSFASLAVGQSRFADEATFQRFDGTQIPFADGEFDVAFAACVFHHIAASEHVQLFAEIGRVLRPSGYFFVFEHNPLNPLTTHAVNTCPFDENAVLIRRGTMAKRLALAGFDVVGHRYRIFFPRVMKGLRPLERWLTWCPLGAQYFVIARKC